MLTTDVQVSGIETSEVEAFLAEGGLAQTADGRVWLGWGAARRGADADPHRLSLYAPDFFLRDERPWRIFDRSRLVDADSLIDRLLPLAASEPKAAWRASSYEAFAAAFEDIQRRIADGSLVKAVPFAARRAPLEWSTARRAAVLANALRRAQGTPLRAYGLWNEAEGLIGTTPETLFEERARAAAPPSLVTMALAGTRTPTAPSLLDDPKEMHEHRVVVDGIVERLAPLGRVAVGPTSELLLPTLVHLETPIEAYPERTVAFDEWVAALHPTAAIGAWPKAAGWRWLLDQPNADERGHYGAPFGFVAPEARVGSCLVAIRNVQWEGERTRLLAGGGIVAGSRVEREWREFNAKLDSIQGALGL